MINIYGKNNTNYNTNGDATLIPIRADLTITLNGSWQLEVEVPYDKEKRYELIEEGAVIICDVGCIRELASTRQRFRIYDYKKGISSVTAIAFPVAMESTHDAPIDNLVISGKTGVQAMAQIQAKTSKYTLYSDITRTGSTSFANTNVNNAIASGSDGCFIDVWGGEIVYDNLKFSVLNRVGNNEQDKHKIIYGKDITDISYEKDDSGLITRIYPISSDGIRLNGSGYVDSPKVSQYPIVHSRYMSAPYKLIEDDIASSTATAQLTRSIKSQITTLASSLSHSVYNTAVASKVEPEYIRKIKADILSAVQSMATANIYNADANKVMQSAIKDGMEWLKDVSKAEWVWHGSDATGWWYGSSTSDRATSQYVYIDRVWSYFGDNSLWQKPRDDASKKWDWIQEASGKRYGNKDKYYAQKTYVYITMNGQMKEYYFDDDGIWDESDDTDSSYAWHGSGSSSDPYWFGDDSTTGKYLKDGWWFIDGTYYYFDSEGYWDNQTKFDDYRWDWVETADGKYWFGNPDKTFAMTYVTNQWLKVGGDWYRFDANGYAVGDTALENEVITRFTSGMAQLKTLCETLNTQAFNLLYSQMRSYCTKMFNTGIDVPSVTITVNMADLSNTSEYAKYQHLEKIYLGDSVTALDYKHNISAVERIVSITYDCIKKVNAVVEIGVASSSLSDILKTDAGGSVAGGFDTSVIESTLTSHTNELSRLDSAKQDKLTAGDNIEIVNNVISATGGGQGLEYWEETSEDFSRKETSELPDRFTAKSEYIFTDSEWAVTDKTTGEVYRAYKKQTGRAICGRFIYWDYQFGVYYKPFYGYAYISTVEDYVKYSQGGSTTPWGTKTINGVTFYVSSNISFCSPNDYNLVHDDVPYIGEFESYSDAVDKLIELADIKAGNQYLDTGLGIGELIIWGGNRYDEEDDFPFYVDREGKIHAKNITVDSVTAETINAEEVISDEHNVLADFVGATGSVDGAHGLVPAPTTNDVGNVLFADGQWRPIGTDIEDIFSIFDTTIINSRYSSGTLTSDSFSFSVNEDNNSWSASATAYNNTAFDITDYNSLIIEVDVTEQSDYGAFWVTLSQTKYTWGAGSWVGVYYNVDSAIKITESGHYEIDVSALSGSYYIYIGASTGKATVARGDCVNNQNGKIIGTVTAFKGIKINGIVPNPAESATDKLKKIKIEDVVYEIADIKGVTEEEYADLPATKNSDNVLYMVRSVEDIFDGGSTITLLGANGVTLQESAVSGNVGTLKAYEYSAGHEGFNIALKNLTVGNTYKLEFDFQFTSAQFIGTDYRCAYLISATQKTNYSDYGQWTENIPRNLQKHHHSVEFTATVTTMYVAFNLDGCSDSVNNYFTMSNIYVIDVDSKNKIMYNGNQYGASAGGGGGSTVIANPSGTATATLNKVSIDGIIYDLPSGGGGGGGSSSSELGLKYDFTKTPLDVLSLTPITLENVTQTDNGLTFNANNSYAYFSGKMLKRNTVYEFEVVSLSITDTTRHNNLFRYQNVGTNQNAGLIYRYQTLKWAVLDSVNGWQDSDISDKDYFNNSTVKIKILNDGKWEIYKDDVLVFAPPLAMVFEGTESFGLGSPNASATSMTIKSFRAYVDGYKESSGGGGELVEYDYAKFNGTGGITLPYTINADYTIEVEFDTPTYYNDMTVIGNTEGGGGRSHLTMYSSRWYCSVGNGSEGNFAGNTTGKHTFITNKDNSNYFDGNVVTTYNPYSASNNYQIGARGSGHYLNGKIYHYKISSISTGDTILDLVPAKLLVAGIEIKSGLYDKINKRFYDGNFITEIGND